MEYGLDVGDISTVWGFYVFLIVYYGFYIKITK